MSYVEIKHFGIADYWDEVKLGICGAIIQDALTNLDLDKFAGGGEYDMLLKGPGYWTEREFDGGDENWMVLHVELSVDDDFYFYARLESNNPSLEVTRVFDSATRFAQIQREVEDAIISILEKED